MKSRQRSGDNPMAQGSRRGVSLRMPPTPIALMIALAALVAYASLFRGGATGSNADDRVARGSGPAQGGAVTRQVVHALARLEPESGIINVGVRPGVRVERI